MASGYLYDPRLSVHIRKDQKDDLDDLIPWGSKKAVISAILDSLIETMKPMNDRDRMIFLACIMSNKVEVGDFMELEKGV